MNVRLYPKISGDLAAGVDQFIAENFYAEGERTPKLLVEEEKFYSRPKAWLLVFESDQIIGTTALHQRKIQFDNKDIVLGGIGRVCTRKDRRRQGIANQMLEEAVKTLRKPPTTITKKWSTISKPLKNPSNSRVAHGIYA